MYETAQTAVVSGIAALADLDGVPVKVTGGRFALDDLVLLLADLPSVLVAPLGGREIEIGGRAQHRCLITWAVYCLSSTLRGATAASMAGVIQRALPGQQWGLTSGATIARPPVLGSIEAVNLYAGKIKNFQVAAWAVTWQQQFFFT